MEILATDFEVSTTLKVFDNSKNEVGKKPGSTKTDASFVLTKEKTSKIIDKEKIQDFKTIIDF